MSPLTEPTRIILRKGWQPMDPDAAAYISAVETADGQALEEPVKIAIDNFVLGCKADGIWSAIKASCILAGARTLNGALVPLVQTSPDAAPTRLGTEGGWNYNRKIGLKGNGTDNYINSGRNNAAEVSQDSKHVSVYASEIATSTISTYPVYVGAGRGAIGATNIGRQLSNSTDLYSRHHSTLFTNTPVAAFPGLIAASRSQAVSYILRGGKIDTSISRASQTPFNGDILVFNESQAVGGPASDTFSNARLAFYSIGEALDLALLDARVTDLINKFAEVLP